MSHAHLDNEARRLAWRRVLDFLLSPDSTPGQKDPGFTRQEETAAIPQFAGSGSRRSGRRNDETHPHK
jgi:hypothetical protein